MICRDRLLSASSRVRGDGPANSRGPRTTGRPAPGGETRTTGSLKSRPRLPRDGMRRGLAMARRMVTAVGGRRRLVEVAGVVAGVLVAAVLVWALWPAGSGPAPRARQYLDFTACLLTGEHGVADADAAPVWAGMQDASLQTRAEVQYLVVVGEQTVANAGPFLASLAQSRCDLVIAVRFVVLGGGATGTNVSVVDDGSPADVRAAVTRIVTNAVRRAPRR